MSKTFNSNKIYAAKSSVVRAIKAAGLDPINYDVLPIGEGFSGIAKVSKKVAEKLVSEKKPRNGNCIKVWEIAESMVGARRKDVVAACVEAGVPMIVLETALPAKFAETIREAVGVEPSRPAKLEGIEALPKRFTVIKPETALVKAFIEQHCA